MSLIAANVLAFMYEASLPPQQLDGFSTCRGSAARTNSQLCRHLGESTRTRVDDADYVPIFARRFLHRREYAVLWILATTLKTAWGM